MRVKYIQLNKIAFSPNLFRSVVSLPSDNLRVIYKPYSNEYDESDEIEYNKTNLQKSLSFYKKRFNLT